MHIVLRRGLPAHQYAQAVKYARPVSYAQLLHRWSSSSSDIVREGDVVLLEGFSKREQALFTKPLRPGSRIENHHGSLADADIIGSAYGSLVRYTSKKASGTSMKVIKPTLEEYVKLSPREVTPVRCTYPLPYIPSADQLSISRFTPKIVPLSYLFSMSTFDLPPIQMLRSQMVRNSPSSKLAPATVP